MAKTDRVRSAFEVITAFLSLSALERTVIAQLKKNRLQKFPGDAELLWNFLSSDEPPPFACFLSQIMRSADFCLLREHPRLFKERLILRGEQP